MGGRTGIMLAYPFEEKRLKKWSPPYIVQPKLDGERCRFIPEGALLLSSQENIFYSVPHIRQALIDLGVNVELDGELYSHGMHFEDIHSIVSRENNLHPDYQQMEYHIFDVVTPYPQGTRTLSITRNYFQCLPFNSPIKLVPYYLANDLDEIMRVYDQILDQGYEGIIVRECTAPYVRKRSTFMMKFKPKKQDDYLIIGYTEEISIEGRPKGRLGAFICKGDDGTEFNVGSGFTAEQRERYWQNPESFVGLYARIEYQHITSTGGVPRFPRIVTVMGAD